MVYVGIPMASKTEDPVSAKLNEDTSERFEDFRNERNITQSEATRRLLRAGLDAKYSAENSDVSTRTFASQLFVTLGVALCVLGSWVLLSTSRAQISFGLLAGGVAAIGVAWPVHSGALPVVDGE
jgi:hypothetical protein